MSEIIEIRSKRHKKSIMIDGKVYVYLNEFADRVGVAPNTVYQWRSEGRLTSFARTYTGRLIFEEKAIEPFKRSLLVIR